MGKDNHSGGEAPARDRNRARVELGQRLALVLEEFTDRAQAARAAGCSEIALRDFVAGRRFPPLEIAARIAGKTGVSLDWLSTGEEPMSRAWRSAAEAPRRVAVAPGPPDPDPAASRAPTSATGINPDLLALVIGMILDALDDDRIELYSLAMAKLISLVYVAVAEADAKAAKNREDVVEIARENLRRLLPQVLAEGAR